MHTSLLTLCTQVQSACILVDTAIDQERLSGCPCRPPLPQTAPMILSPALAPISGKMVEKTCKGLFVDFKEFLADNTMLLQCLTELTQAGAVPVASQPLLSSSRMREVSDPLTWASCFLASWLRRLSMKTPTSLRMG